MAVNAPSVTILKQLSPSVSIPLLPVPPPPITSAIATPLTVSITPSSHPTLIVPAPTVDVCQQASMSVVRSFDVDSDSPSEKESDEDFESSLGLEREYIPDEELTQCEVMSSHQYHDTISAFQESIALLGREWYVGGFFDGDGSVSITKNGEQGFLVSVSLFQSRREVLDAMTIVYGGKIYVSKRYRPNQRTQYIWRVHGREARQIIDALLIGTIIKYRRVQLCAEFLDLVGAAYSQRKVEIFERMADLNAANKLCTRQSTHPLPNDLIPTERLAAMPKAWVAGFFDAEGSIYIRERDGEFVRGTRLKITQKCYPEVLQHIADVVGGGKIDAITWWSGDGAKNAEIVAWMKEITCVKRRQLEYYGQFLSLQKGGKITPDVRRKKSFLARMVQVEKHYDPHICQSPEDYMRSIGFTTKMLLSLKESDLEFIKSIIWAIVCMEARVREVLLNEPADTPLPVLARRYVRPILDITIIQRYGRMTAQELITIALEEEHASERALLVHNTAQARAKWKNPPEIIVQVLLLKHTPGPNGTLMSAKAVAQEMQGKGYDVSMHDVYSYWKGEALKGFTKEFFEDSPQVITFEQYQNIVATDRVTRAPRAKKSSQFQST